MVTRAASFLAAIVTIIVVAGCSGGSSTPKATPTPTEPGPVEVIGDWVRTNRNVDYIGECSAAKPGVDVGKLCVTEAGSRGTRKAFYVGPTFSDNTALALLEHTPTGWTILSVKNRDPNAGPGSIIDWPLQVGDQVVVIGTDPDCLRIREQPTQQGKPLICMPDGTTAIVQEGPVDAETFTWWRVAGDGFNGWAAGTWLRLPEAIAQALNPATPTPAPGG